MIGHVRTTGQLSPILKQLRKAKGWSQIELGKRIGLSQERISVIENHPERMSIDQLLTVLMVLEAEIQVVPRNFLPTKAAEKIVTTGSLKTKLREPW